MSYRGKYSMYTDSAIGDTVLGKNSAGDPVVYRDLVGHTFSFSSVISQFMVNTGSSATISWPAGFVDGDRVVVIVWNNTQPVSTTAFKINGVNVPQSVVGYFHSIAVPQIVSLSDVLVFTQATWLRVLFLKIPANGYIVRTPVQASNLSTPDASNSTATLITQAFPDLGFVLVSQPTSADQVTATPAFPHLYFLDRIWLGYDPDPEATHSIARSTGGSIIEFSIVFPLMDLSGDVGWAAVGGGRHSQGQLTP